VDAKIYTIDRESKVTQEVFKKMCGITKEGSVRVCRLKNKMEMKGYLIPRFKGIISSRVLKYFDFRTPIEFEAFID
jgi:hypothetical protein